MSAVSAAALIADGSFGVPISLGSSSNTASASSISLAAGAIKQGDTIVVLVGHFSNSTDTISSLSDGTNTYLKAGSIGGGASNMEVELWYCVNAVAIASPTITATFTGSVTFRSIGAARATGIRVIDSTPTPVFNSSTASPSISTGVLSSPFEIVFGGLVTLSTAAVTESSGFTTILNDNSASVTNHLAYRITTATSSVTYNPSWTGAAATIAVACSFK